MTFKIAIIGCGLIGKKRALGLDPERLGALFDLDPARARALAQSLGQPELAVSDIAQILNDPLVRGVVVATTNQSLTETTVRCLEAGKWVLVEKPGARSLEEWALVESAEKTASARVRVGYNHRFHPALQKAKALLDEGVAGPLMMIRGRYGHGGRTGYAREWRADPAKSGGGELIDQGVHLLDLAHWIMGPFDEVSGSVETLYWDMAVDDNAFIHLKKHAGQTAWLHASCSEWKNLFSLEIYGRSAKLQIDGLGGSYGPERLTYYRMLPQMGPPDTTVFEFPGADDSWRLENTAFIEDIRLSRNPDPGSADNRKVLSIVKALYDQAARSRGVKK